MKHTRKEALKAKNNLISHCYFREIDFIETDTIRMVSKDNVMLSAFDVWKEHILTLKEEDEII